MNTGPNICQAWNTHDAAAVGAFFSEAGSLRDWDVAVEGRGEVAAANGKIFAAVPGIAIEVLRIHVSSATTTAVAEILVKLNNAAGDVLKVVRPRSLFDAAPSRVATLGT